MNDLTQINAATKPQASQISAGLVNGTDPLDFIKQNLRNAEAQTALQNQQPQQQPPQPAQQPIAPNQFTDKETGLELPYETKQPTVQTKAEDKAPVEAIQTEGDEKVTKGPEESIKQLRKKTIELAKTAIERETEANTLKEELEKYKTGEAMPEVLEKYKQRIEELEQYEQLHALKMSKNYTAKYIEPLETLKNKAVSIAEDYNVNPTVLDKAIQITNKRDLNAFLRNHFDDVGALEVRDILTNIRQLDAEAREAEAAPQQTLQQLREEQRNYETKQEQQRVAKIASTAKSGWVEALTELRDKGEYPEITLLGDEEHDKYVRPILNEAATEYGKFVKELGLVGAKELRPEAAKILAKRYLLSQAAAIAMESRAQHHQRAEEVLATSKRQASFVRPPVGGGAVTAPASAPSKPNSPEEAAIQLLQKIGLG